MRVQDFILEDAVHRGGIDVEEHEDAEDPSAIWITASTHGRDLGHVKFYRQGDTVVAQELEVKPEYRGQGIARIMYDYAKELGYRVMRSAEQTDAGAGFWDKYRGRTGVWEQEVNEVQILAKVKGKGSEPGQLPKFGREILPDQQERYLGQQVGKMGRYSIWQDWLGGQLSYHLFDPRSRTAIVTTFGSRYHGNPHSYIIHGLYAAPGNPVKAHQFYRALIQDLGLTLISDRKQSPGGNRVWQRLEAYPDIEVYGFDTKTGEVMNFGAQDSEMYAVPPRAAKDRESRYVAKNIRLVATAR